MSSLLDMKTTTLDIAPCSRWTIGALTAVGVGVGAALAASAGPVGWAVGLALPATVAGVRAARRR